MNHKPRTEATPTSPITESPSTSSLSELAATIVTVPRPVTAMDRLLTLYASPAPFTSVYLATMPLLGFGEENTIKRWDDLRPDLEAQGAPQAALNAIEARLALPRPDDTAGVAVIAAADGTTIVDHGLEPPRYDVGMVNSLPYAAPLLEWQQNRVAHLVVTADDAGIDIAIFGLDHFTRLDSYKLSPTAAVEPIAETAGAIDAEMIVLNGDTKTVNPLADRLVKTVPNTTKVVTDTESTTADELAVETVRHLSNLTAEATTRHLRSQRFLGTHDAAVDGIVDTVASLRDASADIILVHDDPEDHRQLWIGPGPNDIATEAVTGFAPARLVDAIIRSAVLQNIPVRIIPTTGPDGPDDNTAAMKVDTINTTPF